MEEEVADGRLGIVIKGPGLYTQPVGKSKSNRGRKRLNLG